MKLRIGKTNYDLKLKDKMKGRCMGINTHKGFFDVVKNDYIREDEIILYGEEVGSPVFWHEVVHAIFAELVDEKIYGRMATKMYHDERLVDKIANIIFEVNKQII
jgi:hypothetical protein